MRVASDPDCPTKEQAQIPDLIAIGYDDASTAIQTLDEVGLLAHDLVIQPDAVAVIIRVEDDKFRTITNQHEVGAGATWGMFWVMLFGLPFFVPTLGMAMGPAFGALGGKIARSSISKEFQEQVRARVQPGTSAVFLIVEQMTTVKALAGLSRFGVTVLTASLSEADEAELQAALHLRRRTAGVSRWFAASDVSGGRHRSRNGPLW